MPLNTPCFGIIPARYASSRFPGKPLADILGRPMFWHVYQRARRCPDLQQVALATDDDRIRSAAVTLGVPVVMTAVDHSSGTDRVLEAAEQMMAPADAVIVNIQGDEPLLDPEMITRLVAPFERPGVDVSTLAYPLAADQAGDPNRVKVVFDRQNRALYFSRAPIPWDRSGDSAAFFGHVGLYAFRMHTLRRFVTLGRGRLEVIEKLEQLRLIENGIAIRVILVDHAGFGVDCPEDLSVVIETLRKQSVFRDAGESEKSL